MISTKVVVNSNGTQNILSNSSGNKGICIYYEDNKLEVRFGNGKTWIWLDPVEIDINKKYDIPEREVDGFYDSLELVMSKSISNQ